MENGQVKAGRTDRPDIHHYRKKLEWSYRALAKETFPERDKELIREFVDYIAANGVSPGRLTKMLYTMMVLRREIKCGFEAMDRAEAERIMRWTNGSDYKAWTKSDMKGALKRFMKWVRLRNLDSTLPFPPEVAWIKSTLKRNELLVLDCFEGGIEMVQWLFADIRESLENLHT